MKQLCLTFFALLLLWCCPACNTRLVVKPSSTRATNAPGSRIVVNAILLEKTEIQKEDPRLVYPSPVCWLNDCLYKTVNRSKGQTPDDIFIVKHVAIEQEQIFTNYSARVVGKTYRLELGRPEDYPDLDWVPKYDGEELTLTNSLEVDWFYDLQDILPAIDRYRSWCAERKDKTKQDKSKSHPTSTKAPQATQ